MRQELKDALLAWKNRPSFAAEQRKIRIASNPGMKNEFRIEISMSETIRFKNTRETAEETRFLSTLAQDGNLVEIEGQPYPNPEGDVFRFNTIAINVENAFWIKREDALTRIIQNEMPDGFFDFNDL